MRERERKMYISLGGVTPAEATAINQDKQLAGEVASEGQSWNPPFTLTAAYLVHSFESETVKCRGMQIGST